jgi:hypothetical protein
VLDVGTAADDRLFVQLDVDQALIVRGHGALA